MAKRKKQKLTPLQKEAKKQIKRLKSAIKRYKKQGFDVNFEIPEQKRITKKYVETLQNIKYIDVLAQSYKVNPETGEIKSGWHIRFLDKKEKQNFQSYTKQDFSETDYANNIISNFFSYLSLFPIPIFSEIRSFIKQQIEKYGVVLVAQNLLIYNDTKLEEYLKMYASNQAIEQYETNFVNDLAQAYDNSEQFKESMERLFDETQ